MKIPQGVTPSHLKAMHAIISLKKADLNDPSYDEIWNRMYDWLSALKFDDEKDKAIIVSGMKYLGANEDTVRFGTDVCTAGKNTH